MHPLHHSLVFLSSFAIVNNREPVCTLPVSMNSRLNLDFRISRHTKRPARSFSLVPVIASSHHQQSRSSHGGCLNQRYGFCHFMQSRNRRTATQRQILYNWYSTRLGLDREDGSASFSAQYIEILRGTLLRFEWSCRSYFLGLLRSMQVGEVRECVIGTFLKTLHPISDMSIHKRPDKFPTVTGILDQLSRSTR